jgi:uncharacterized membrane protein
MPAIAIFANAAIVVPLAVILNLWQDEAYTLHTTGRTVQYAFVEAIRFEQNAPLYFVLVNLWRHVDGSVFFGRLFSALCIAVALVLLPGLAERYLPGIAPGWITLTIALNPFAIWAALEMRVYALVILMSALLLRTFFDAFLRPGPVQGGRVFFYALTVAAAIYTQYYLAFLVVAQGLALFCYARQSLPHYIAGAAIGGAAFLPLAAALPAQIRNFRGAFTPPSLLEALSATLKALAEYVVPLEPLGKPDLLYVIAAVIAVIFLIVVRKRLSLQGQPLIVVVTVCASVLLAVALYIARVQIENLRELAMLFLPATLSAFGLLTFVRRDQGRAVAGWAVISIALSLLSLFFTYRPLAKPGDWIRVTAYLQKHETAHEPIAVFEAENALPLRYYYHGPNRIVPIPAGVNFRTYDVMRFVVKSDAQLARLLPARKKIWLITAGGCRTANIEFGCDIVEGYVARHYRIGSVRIFHGAEVRLLIPKVKLNRRSSH